MRKVVQETRKRRVKTENKLQKFKNMVWAKSMMAFKIVVCCTAENITSFMCLLLFIQLQLSSQITIEGTTWDHNDEECVCWCIGKRKQHYFYDSSIKSVEVFFYTAVRRNMLATFCERLWLHACMCVQDVTISVPM